MNCAYLAFTAKGLALAQQLAEKTAGRQYYALVHGVINHEYGTIDAPIGRICIL